MTLLRPSFEECPPELYEQNKALRWIGTKVKNIRKEIGRAEVIRTAIKYIQECLLPHLGIG